MRANVSTAYKTKKPPERKMPWQDKAFIIAMICLPLLHFAVFTLYINFSSLLMAFQKVNYQTNTVEFAGLYNFNRIIESYNNGRTWAVAIKNSLWYFPVTAFIMLPLSIVAGYFLLRKIPLYQAFKVIFFMPSIISIVVLAIVFRDMFEYQGPVFMLLTEVLGVSPNDVPAWLNDPNHTMNILYLYAIWAGIGYNVVLLFGAMSRVPAEVVESARLDGIGMMREIRSIYIPIIWPTISTMIVFSALTVFTQFIHPLVLTYGGNGESQTIALIIVQNIGFGKYYEAAALGILLAIIATPIVQLVKYITGKIYETVEV